jgi:hypothetical protein
MKQPKITKTAFTSKNNLQKDLVVSPRAGFAVSQANDVVVSPRAGFAVSHK